MRKEAIAGLAWIVVVLALSYAAVAVSNFMAYKFRWVHAEAVREIPL